DRLMAHELAHVTQVARVGSDVGVEDRADRAAERLAAGQATPASLLGGASAGIHCQLDPSRPAGTAPRRHLPLQTFSGFRHGQWALKPEQRAQISFLAQSFFGMSTRAPGSKLVLTGHTDLTGEERANLELGRKRALEVAAALAVAGLPAASMRIESAGEAE